MKQQHDIRIERTGDEWQVVAAQRVPVVFARLDRAITYASELFDTAVSVSRLRAVVAHPPTD